MIEEGTSDGECLEGEGIEKWSTSFSIDKDTLLDPSAKLGIPDISDDIGCIGGGGLNRDDDQGCDCGSPRCTYPGSLYCRRAI